MAILRRLILALVVLGCTAPLWAQTAKEDDPTRNGELGMPILAKRCDTSASSSGTDGDHTMFCVDSSGALWVHVINTLATDVTEDTASADAVTGPTPLEVRRDAAATSASADGDYATKNQDAQGLSWTRFLDPCSGVQKTTTPISLTTDTVIISAVSAKKNYICALVVVASAAEVVSVTEGTAGTTCNTSEAALAGSTTDANGMSFAANGGVGLSGGNSTIIAGKTTNVDTCLNVSGSNRVSGWVTWVQAP